MVRFTLCIQAVSILTRALRSLPPSLSIVSRSPFLSEEDRQFFMSFCITGEKYQMASTIRDGGLLFSVCLLVCLPMKEVKRERERERERELSTWRRCSTWDHHLSLKQSETRFVFEDSCSHSSSCRICSRPIVDYQRWHSIRFYRC